MNYSLYGVGTIERFKQGSCPSCVGTIWTGKSRRDLHVSFCQGLGEKSLEIIALQNSQGREAKWSLFLWLCAQSRRMLAQPSGHWQRSDTSQSTSFLHLMSTEGKCPETLTSTSSSFAIQGLAKSLQAMHTKGNHRHMSCIEVEILVGHKFSALRSPICCRPILLGCKDR